MLRIRKADDRGRTRLGWLDSWHTFSFGDYYDPGHMHFRALRVINDDFIAPAGGFPMHGHRDMEIVTWVVAGALEHQDSMGHGSVIRPGEAQRMSAGTGVLHSERNPSSSEPLRLLQIWMLPDRRGAPPGYEQKVFADAELADRLCCIAGPAARGGGGGVSLQLDASIHATRLAPGRTVTHALAADRQAWVQVVTGEVDLNGTTLGAGDGAGLMDERAVVLTGRKPCELLLFDLA